jgi:GntR family transcriptional regulator
MLPPITQLADDLGVAVVTVRQAYELSRKEGLIRSQRGVGTHVAALPAAVGDLELAINDPFAAPQALAFEILEVQRRTAVPLDCSGRRTGRRRKRLRPQVAHLFRRAVLLCRDLCADVGFRIAAQGHREKRKLLAAVLDELGPRCRRVRQRMTVMPADFPLCDMLKVPFASPVAKMSRLLVDGKATCCTPVSPGTGATATSPRSTSPCPP